jgi:putative ABC transport system permease protein
VDFRKRFPLRFGRPDVDEEVDAELEFHLAMRTRELMARGMSETHARREALDRFGDLVRARRECRSLGHQREQRMRLLQYCSELRQDAAFAVRQMLRAPGFSVVAILTLALGIGATTAIFGAVHAVVLEPLPLPAPDRLIEIHETWGDREGAVSVSTFHDIAAATDVWASSAAIQAGSYTLEGDGSAERVIGARVTGGYFDVMGMAAASGRTFGSSEDQPGREQVVVLSHRLWTRRFGSDPGIVGRDILLNQRPHVVLGVMPAAFDLTSFSPELWVPAAFTPAQIERRDEHYLTVYARLRQGMSIANADERLAAVMRRRSDVYPKETQGRGLHARPMIEDFVGDYRNRLLVLFGAVGLVLLIACGNVSNLLLARGASRARELAVRGALGAGQGRLVRQLFTESLVLAALSAGAGVLLARTLLAMLVATSPAGVPRLEQARIDGVTLAFAIGVAVVASIVFGVVPAWRASRADVNSTLKEASRGAGARGARDAVRSTLIAAEIALALVLLVGAGLLIRSAIAMQGISPGFDPKGLFSGRMLLSMSKYQSPASLLQAAEAIEQAIDRVPGVKSAALASSLPGAHSFSNGLRPEGAPLELGYETQSDGVFVSPAFFRAMGIRTVAGRGFDANDRANSMLVVILNETAARAIWPGQDPIGKRVWSVSPLGLATVVGVVADTRIGGPSELAPPTFYVPLAQLEQIAWGWTRGAFFVVARTDGDPSALAEPVRRALATVDPAVPLYNVRTMESRMAATVDSARFNTVLLTLLGVAGLVLAAVGIYGVIAYFASQRTSEIGIRMALGATREQVVRMVVRQAAGPLAAGIGIGLIGAFIAAKAVESQLVVVTSRDPVTFVAVVLFLVLVSLGAAMIPARRAAKLDPRVALQS